jgi:hypothetical protein
MVFDGSLHQFLLDNDNDEWLTSECEKLIYFENIELNEISGTWIISRQ